MRCSSKEGKKMVPRVFSREIRISPSILELLNYCTHPCCSSFFLSGSILNFHLRPWLFAPITLQKRRSQLFNLLSCLILSSCSIIWVPEHVDNLYLNSYNSYNNLYLSFSRHPTILNLSARPTQNVMIASYTSADIISILFVAILSLLCIFW